MSLHGGMVDCVLGEGGIGRGKGGCLSPSGGYRGCLSHNGLSRFRTQLSLLVQV